MPVKPLPEEIQSLVLHYVNEPATLANCARVCSYWHDQSMRLLWRGVEPTDPKWRTPTIDDMVKIAYLPYRTSQSRLSKYLGLVEALSLRCSCDDADEDCDQPQLERNLDAIRYFVRSDALGNARLKAKTVQASMINLRLSNACEPELLEMLALRCLHHDLVELSIPDMDVTEVFARTMEDRCPRLEILYTGDASAWSSVDIFSHFLRSMREQRYLRMPTLWTEDPEGMRNMQNAVLQHPNLEQVEIDYQAFDDASLDVGHKILPSLTSLRLGPLAVAQIHALGPHLPHLQALSLAVDDYYNDVDLGLGGCVAPLHNLVELELFIDSAEDPYFMTVITIDDLLAIAHNCPLLSYIRLPCFGQFARRRASSPRETITTEHVRTFVQCLPKLKQLVLQVPFMIEENPFLSRFRTLKLGTAEVPRLTDHVQETISGVLEELVPELSELYIMHIALPGEEMAGATVCWLGEAINEYFYNKRGWRIRHGEGDFVDERIREERKRRWYSSRT